MRIAAIALGAILVTGSPARAQLQDPPVTDAELAAARGRFTLPNGQQLALTVRSDTSVDGQLLLRSVLSVNDTASLSVFTPGDAAPGTSQTARAVTAPDAAAPRPPIVTIDAATGMPNIRAVSVAGSPSISVNAAGRAAPSNAGLQQVPVVIGGPAIETASGAVRVIESAGGRTVTLDGNGIGVSQLLGPAFGSIIANTASNRTIDTNTTVDIGLSNMGSTLVDSAMLRVANIAASATRTPF